MSFLADGGGTPTVPVKPFSSWIDEMEEEHGIKNLHIFLIPYIFIFKILYTYIYNILLYIYNKCICLYVYTYAYIQFKQMRALKCRSMIPYYKPDPTGKKQFIN